MPKTGGVYGRFALCISPLLGVIMTSACTSTDVNLSFQFSDTGIRERVTRIMVTVAEPFTIPESQADSIAFVGCQDLGFFRPSARYDRSEKQLAGLTVHVDRDFRNFPLTEDWDVLVPDMLEPSEDNPWGALMVYFEARGPAFSQREGMEVVEEETLLSACQCVRRFDEVSSGNPDLDELVESKCRYIGSGDVPESELTFGSLVTEVVELDTCSSEEYVAANEGTSKDPHYLQKSCIFCPT